MKERMDKATTWRFRIIIVSISIVSLMIVFGAPLDASETSAPVVNGFFIITAPANYEKLERLFSSVKDAGANTIMIRVPIEERTIDKDSLTNMIFLAHHARLKLFVIVPTRAAASALASHPEWEDMRYDLGSGTVQPAGRLDLVQPRVIEYLTDLIKDIAAYSVDGILLDEQYFYGDTEGLSTSALEAYKQKSGKAFVAGNAFIKVGGDADTPVVEEYGDPFWTWAEFKENVLLDAAQSLRKAARSVNPAVRFGMPIPLSGPATPQEVLARCSYDFTAFKKADIDYYWIAIPHREMKARQNLSYKKTMELISRTVQCAAALVKEPEKTIAVVQARSLAGKIVPLTEVEEATLAVKKAYNPGIAFMIGAENTIPPAFAKKMFRRP